jgi:hypothetical protein
VRIVFPVVDYTSRQCGGLVGRATGVPRADVAMAHRAHRLFFSMGTLQGPSPVGVTWSCMVVCIASRSLGRVARAGRQTLTPR